MGKAYLYVVDRDFGFAPNPFHGYCTLATCKPKIRKQASLGDWIVGMGGSRLKATGRIVFAMRVTEKLTFNEYWVAPRFLAKRPVRNGSKKMMVGDNIYHIDSSTNSWQQADSHHSNTDGSINYDNLRNDTSSNNVLISQQFYYFGSQAYLVPNAILESIGYRNGRGYRVYSDMTAAPLIHWIERSFASTQNYIVGDPFDFDHSEKRYSISTNKIA